MKAATAKTSFAFTGWDKPIVPVTGDADYTAVFEATYDVAAIILRSTNNLPYQMSFLMDGNTPITTAKEGEDFTFFLGNTNRQIYTVLLNGEALSEDQVYFIKKGRHRLHLIRAGGSGH